MEYKNRLMSDPGRINIEDRVKIGTMVKSVLDAKREEYSQKILACLEVNCEEVRKHELMDDKMVGNYAFLINKDKQIDFDEKLENLNKIFEDNINFRCIGPLPPYSSYTIEIKKIQHKDFEWARVKLELLCESATELNIKEAYRKAIYLSHPDSNQGVPGMENKLNDVVSAYGILSDYCLACQQTGQNDIYSFNEKEFKKNTILVKLKNIYV